MPTTAKICGLSTADTLAAAIAGGASHVGFVFFPASPRNVLPAQAAALAALVPDGIGRVGVVVDADDALLDAAIAAGGLTALQLHGRETPERAAALRARHGVEVWKAIAVKRSADLDEARRYHGAVDRILFDARTPPGALPGGMGARFDWTMLRGYRHLTPWALSGGLDAAAVAEAVATTGATLVDVSSGVESAPGIKDVDKIAAFLQAVHRI